MRTLINTFTRPRGAVLQAAAYKCHILSPYGNVYDSARVNMYSNVNVTLNPNTCAQPCMLHSSASRCCRQKQVGDLYDHSSTREVLPAELPTSTAVVEDSAQVHTAFDIVNAAPIPTGAAEIDCHNVASMSGQRHHHSDGASLQTAAQTTAAGAGAGTNSPVILSTGSTWKHNPKLEKQTAHDACEVNKAVLGGGCQSSAERNIWSVFNPIWDSLPVTKARLPRASDARADWAGTVGQPGELKHFLGLKNPVNHTRVTMAHIDRQIAYTVVRFSGRPKQLDQTMLAKDPCLSTSHWRVMTCRFPGVVAFPPLIRL